MIPKKIKRYRFIVAAVLLIIVPEFFFRAEFFYRSADDVAQELSDYIDTKVKKANKDLDSLLNNQGFASTLKSTSTSYTLFEYGEPVQWNSSQLPVIQPPLFKGKKSFLSAGYIGNGYYVTVSKALAQKQAVAFIPVYKQYKFTNSYLTNAFEGSLRIPDRFGIMEPGKAGPQSKKIKYHGEVLFCIEQTNQNFDVPPIMVATQLMGLFLFFLSLIQFSYVFAHKSPFTVTVGVVTALFGVKLLVSGIGILHLLKQSEIFNPETFASGWLNPSLGDFLISFTAVFAACFYLYKSHFLFLQGNKLKFMFYTGMVTLTMLVTQYLLFSGLENLVLNSKIDFFFKNVHSLNVNTIIGIGSLGFGLFGIMFLLSRLRIFYNHYPPSIRLVVFLQAALLVVFYVVFNDQYVYQSCAFSMLLVVYIVWPERKALSPFNSTAVVLVVFSIISSTIFYSTTLQKEHNDRKLLAEKLADNQDPDVEIEFSTLLEGLSNDQFIRQFGSKEKHLNQYDLEQYLDTRYFNRIIRDYDLEYSIFINDTSSGFRQNYYKSDLKKFEKTIALHGKKTASRNLYYIYNHANGIDYLASITFSENRLLIIQFASKKIPRLSGLNELLTQHNQFYTKLSSDYSFARFVNNNHVEEKGSFLYANNATVYKGYNKKFNFYTQDGYDHLLYRLSSDRFVLVSKPVFGWLAHVTSFSYILILFAVQFGLISVLLYRSKIKTGVFNLSAKIQLAFIALTIVAMTLFGLTTQYSISHQYSNKNQNLVADKLFSLHSELKAKNDYKSSLDSDPDQKLEALLVKFSKIFLTDINFYNPDGILVASSASKVYRYNIIGPLMNRAALQELSKKEKPIFVHNESVGQLNYVSGYMPLYNNTNILLGYINVPFFPRQSSIDSEFSALLMAIINIFVVLFAFTILISVIITQIIISPLTKIRESIASMQLNKVNKPILYKGKDELAELVKEYNNKVAELEKYAFYLAQNERETAWREMAKQVAHEIKNPLTPMKLNIQHMQRSLKPNDPDFDQKLGRITHSLIEQIDTLSNITSEFSNLAKMPGSKFENFEFVHLIESVIELYNDDENTTLDFVNHLNGPQLVNGDKEQLLRVLNNLVKNAQQAIPDHRHGHITIKAEMVNKRMKVSVMDNGVGIAVEQQERIFQPNFTTKSTGSGLGLAMVKNIIEQHKGTIQFQTQLDFGTTFIFELPVIS